MQEQQKKILTYDGAAELLGLPKGTIYAMVSRKELPHYRLSNRNVRFDQEKLIQWLDKRHVQEIISVKANKRGAK